MFFPSYKWLNIFVNTWRINKTENKINKYKKIFIESNNPENLETLNKYKDFIKNIEKNNQQEDTCNGALLLAVYRGRASEGLDFSGNKI
jgi:Rad3-related DNA helicase